MHLVCAAVLFTTAQMSLLLSCANESVCVCVCVCSWPNDNQELSFCVVKNFLFVAVVPLVRGRPPGRRSRPVCVWVSRSFSKHTLAPHSLSREFNPLESTDAFRKALAPVLE